MATTIEELVELVMNKTQEKKKISFEEYLTLTTDKKAEWVDGEVVYMTLVSIRHEQLRGFLFFVLKGFVQRHNLGSVFGPETMMRLEEQRRGREPDILFITNNKTRLLREDYLDGAADLVVEIVSPESIGRDRGEKFIEYEAAGIKEYWLIDPHRYQAEFYNLGVDGRYYLMSLDSDGIFRSNVIEEFWLRVEWLWALPNELDVLRELQVI
jgi:Uma2 family endonuclease